MIPFRVFDPHKKTTWIVLNFQPSTNDYLVAREDESDEDGTILTLTVNDLKACQMIDFVDSDD